MSNITITISIPSHGRTEIHSHIERVYDFAHLIALLQRYSVDEHNQRIQWLVTTILDDHITFERYDTQPQYMRKHGANTHE